jgi:sialic acid synthase SpsE
MGSKREDTLKRTDMQKTAMEKRGEYLREINMLFLRASDKIHKYFIKQYMNKTL